MPRTQNRPPPPQTPEISRPIRLDRLPQESVTRFSESATPAERVALARLFDARSVDRFRFEGSLSPLEGGGWALEGRLLATVIQACVVSLVPVAQKLDEPMRRRFLPGKGGSIDIDPDEAEEVEPLTDQIDLGAVAIETAALALDPYPRAPSAELALPQATGDAPTAFAALAALRERLEPKG